MGCLWLSLQAQKEDIDFAELAERIRIWQLGRNQVWAAPFSFSQGRRFQTFCGLFAVTRDSRELTNKKAWGSLLVRLS